MSSRGWEGVTRADVTRRELQQAMQAKPSKYHAVKTTVDGITFDSAKEAKRYWELKLLEKAGLICNLALQPEFGLHTWHEDHSRCPLVGNYVADFSYCVHPLGPTIHSWCVVEDVKGFKTSLYKWKKKHAEAQYGIVIREI